MVSPINTSLSALQAASRRMQVAANNIANQQSTATRVNGETVNEAYKPQEVVQTSNNGAVITDVRTVANPTEKLYLPEHPQADEYGFVESPNVDQAKQLIDMKIASYDYKANLKAIKIANDVEQSLLDILS